MSKTQVAVELEKMKGSIAKVVVPVMEEKKVEKKVKAVKPKVEDVPSAPAVLEKVAKKVAEPKVKAEKKVAVEKKAVEPKEEKQTPSKYIKGSAEAKERMAAIRSARGKKTE
jgi:hypothetical protein